MIGGLFGPFDRLEQSIYLSLLLIANFFEDKVSGNDGYVLGTAESNILLKEE
jgi:hypothetical protein